MTLDLGKLREQERQHAILERDIVLAQEVQQHLYPRLAPRLPAASVWGMTTPARIVSFPILVKNPLKRLLVVLIFYSFFAAIGETDVHAALVQPYCHDLFDIDPQAGFQQNSLHYVPPEKQLLEI
jgi:hypothetical protein